VDKKCASALIYLYQLKGGLYLENKNPSKAIELFENALELAKKENRIEEQKACLGFITDSYEFRDDYLQALEMVDTAIDLKCPSQNRNCLKEGLNLLINKAEVLKNLGKIDSAILELNKATQQLELGVIGDSLQRLQISRVMGIIYQEELRDYDSSLKSFLDGLNYAPKGHPLQFEMQNNVGNAYVMMSQADDAIKYYNKTLDETANPKYTYRPLLGLGDIYSFMQGDFHKGLEYYLQAYDHVVKTGQKHYINTCKAQIGKANYFLGEYNTAIKYLKESLDYYSQENVTKVTKTTLLTKRLILLSEIALLDTNLNQKALDFFEDMDTITNRQQAIEHDESLSRLQNELDEIKFKKKEVELWKGIYALLLVTCGLIGFLGGVFLLYKKNKKQKEELEEINKNLHARLRKKSAVYDYRIQIKGYGKESLVPVNEIVYITPTKKGAEFHKIDNSIILSELTMDKLQKNLEDPFIRIHRSSIINIDQIDFMNSKYLKMKDGNELPIGRTYKEELRNKLKELEKN